MAVSTTTNRESFTGGAGPFAFTFKAFEASDIKVVIRSSAGVETTLVRDTHYTAAVNPTVGGTVTLIGIYVTTPPTASDTVVVYREIPYTQDIDLIENDPQRAEVIEEGFDRATVLAQQLKDLMSRSLLLPVSASQSGLVLPEPSALKYMRWNAGGTALENIALTGDLVAVSSFIEALLDDADLASALATLGLDVDLATLSLPASTTISAFIKTLLDDADAAAARATIGVSIPGRVNKTQADSPYTVVAANLTGLVVFTNTGASGQCIFQFPAGADGYKFRGVVTAAQYMQFLCNGTEKIRFLTTQTAAGGYVRCNVVGNIIEGEWSGTEWVITGLGGPWTYDS